MKSLCDKCPGCDSKSIVNILDCDSDNNPIEVNIEVEVIECTDYKGK
jgi:hypothetical protein